MTAGGSGDRPTGARATPARELLARHGLQAKKSWGQNFLLDPSVQTRIVAAAEISGDDTVVEIGAGLGALTVPLAAKACKVIAVERDPDLVGVLRAELAGNERVDIVALDALDFDLGAAAATAGRALIVVGNLPYQITSPLVFRITDAAAGGTAVARAVLMVQREFAERMMAGPGTRTYGRLSVMVQQWAEVKILFHVGSGAFHPPPAVTSTVLRLTPRASALAAARDPALFSQVVRAAFGTRRKMLRRALEPAFGRAAAEEALARAGIAGTRRAEELGNADFARLADALGEGGAVAARSGTDDGERDA